MVLPTSEKQYLDGRHVTTIADLREMLQSWESTEGSFFGEDHRPRTPGNQQHYSHSMECYKCVKPGHRAAECRSRNTNSDRQQNSDKPLPKCFTCGVVGHKSPDCPTRITIKREPEDKSKKDKKNTLYTNCVLLLEKNLVENEIQATVATPIGHRYPDNYSTGGDCPYNS